MKTTFFLVFLCLLTSATSNAQVDTATLQTSPTLQQDPGTGVQTLPAKAFATAHPGVLPAWTTNGALSSAEYCDSLKSRHIITYDEDGKVVSWQNQLRRDTYPAPIDDYYKKHFAGEPYTVWSSDNADNANVLYFFSRKTSTYWFDSAGHFRETAKNKLVR